MQERGRDPASAHLASPHISSPLTSHFSPLNLPATPPLTSHLATHLYLISSVATLLTSKLKSPHPPHIACPVAIPPMLQGIMMLCFFERRDEDEDVPSSGAPSAKPDEKELRSWFEDADTDGTGRLTLTEFEALVKVEMNPKRRERVRQSRQQAVLASAPPAVPQPQPLPPLPQSIAASVAAAAGAEAAPPSTPALMAAQKAALGALPGAPPL